MIAHLLCASIMDERMITKMIQVSKEEMAKLRERFPGIHATRTVHKYYVEERREIIAFLKNNCKPLRYSHA